MAGRFSVKPLLQRIRYCARFLRFHSIHRRSRSTIKAWQQQHLRRLVAYAAENVPFHRGITEGNLPVVTKAQYVAKKMEDYTDRSRPLKGGWANTSGTSGVPFRVLKRPNIFKSPFMDSLQFRFLMWEKPWRMNVSWARIATIKVRGHDSPHHLYIPIEEFLRDAPGSMQRLMNFQPLALESYASMLIELAKRAKAGHALPSLRYVFSGGENMSAENRRFVEEALCVKVINRYALEETGVIASECSVHEGLHTNCESFIVEVVDTDGNALPEGETGRIIVTDLFNFSMPYIRYDTGDHGRLSWKKCSCGVTAPRLWLEGRHSAFLDFPERRIHHLEFDAVLDMFMLSVAQYQVVKLSDSSLEVRVVPGKEFTDAVRAEVARNVEKLVGPMISVSVSVVDSIPLTPRGKSKIVSDESGG